MRPTPCDVVATDLDRTFTRLDLSIDDSALAAVADLRRNGVLAVLATGRSEAEVAERPALTRAFDGYALESGALCGRWGDLRPADVRLEGLKEVAGTLEAEGVRVWRGRLSASIDRAHLARATALGARHGVTALPNRDRVDLVPAGIDKGAGLRRILALIAPRRHLRVVAIGDGENDAGLLRAADHRVAVANATQGLVALAHEVTPHPAADGFTWLVRQRLLA